MWRFFQKHKKFFYFDNFCRMWLVNEIVPAFSVLIKYAKAQFNLIILLRVIEYTSYRQTNINSRKNHFFLTQGVSKRKDLMKILKVIFHIKPKPHMMGM